MDLKRLAQRRTLASGLIALAAVAVYLTSLRVPFLAWDDTYYVTQSLRTQAPGLAGFLNLWSLQDVWHDRFFEYFPLRDSVYWAIYQLFGKNPVPFHCANVLAHAVCAVLVLALGRRLGLSAGVAFGGALLFAVHPIHVESVTWIAVLKDPLFTALLIGSVLCFARYRQSLRPLDYALCLVLLVASCLSKSIAICAPLLFLAVDRLTPTPPPWRLTVARVAGPALVSAIILVQVVMIGQAAGATTPPHAGGWGSHFFLAGWAFVRYAQQAVAPVTFLLHYCFAPPSGPLDWRGPLIALALALAAGGFLFGLRRAPLLALLIGWFVAALLPVSNLVPHGAIMADRYLYAPSVASCLLLAWGLSALPQRLRGSALLACAAAYAAITLVRNELWRDEGNLWAEVVENPACAVDDQPTSAVAFLKHAGFQKDPRAALESYAAGISHPAFGTLFPADRCAYLDAAAETALNAKDRPRAEDFAVRSIELCPWSAASWRTRMLVAARAQPEVAVEAARRAFRLSPVPSAQWHLGQARLAAGDGGGAQDVVAAVVRAPERFCAPFARWAAQAHPPEESLAPARAACAQLLQKQK